MPLAQMARDTRSGSGRWRTWALVGFGTGVAAVVGQSVVSGTFLMRPNVDSSLIQGVAVPLSMMLQALSLASGGCVVAAVLTGRREALGPRSG